MSTLTHRRSPVRWAALLIALLGTLPHTGCDERPAQVRACFNNFFDACNDRRGSDAAALLCKDNYDYYMKVRDLALTANKQELMARPLVERVEALLARVLVDHKTLRTLDGRGVFAAVTSAGGNEFPGQIRLTKIKMGRESATGRCVIDGGDAGLGYTFSLEEDQWKIDFQSPDKKIAGQLKDIARKERMTEEELTLAFLSESVDEQLLGPEIWKPPGK